MNLDKNCLASVSTSNYMSNVKILFLGISLYICSLGLFSSHVYLLWGIVYYLMNRFKILPDSLSICCLCIWALSFINQIVGFLNGYIPQSFLEFLPYSFLILVTIQLAKNIDERVLLVFVCCLIVDVFVGIYQKMNGIVSFYDVSQELVEGDDMLYNTKVFGLSTNSSGFAANVFLALMIYQCYDFNKKISPYFFYPVIIIGLLLSFNRSVLLGTAVFVLIELIYSKKKGGVLVLLFLGTSVLLYFILQDDLMELIMKQFLRGHEDIASAGFSEREIIYPFFVDFISNHLWLGNHSYKLLIDMGDGRILHAHNSYLQTLATNGIIISLFYCYLIFHKMTFKNMKFIFPFLIISITQTFILWGISLNDLIFYGILLSDYRRRI